MQIIQTKFYLVKYFFLLFSIQLSAQTCDWWIQIQCERELEIKKIEVDQSGNLYVLLFYSGKVRLDQNSDILDSGSGYIIASYDSKGNLRWHNEGNYLEPWLDFTIDDEENLFLLTLSDDDNQTSGHIYKINSKGEITDHADFGVVKKEKYLKTSKVLVPNGIDVDEEGNIYITGGFQGEATFLNKKISSKKKITSFGDEMPSMDIFLAKYTSDLKKLLWAKTAGGNNHDYAKFVSVSSNGNVFVGGTFIKEASFENTNLESVWLGDEYADVFIAAYNTNGEFQWVNKAGGKFENQIVDLKSDNENNVYITVTGLPGKNNFELAMDKYRETKSGYYIAKFNSRGILEWSTETKENPVNRFNIYKNKIYLLSNGTIGRYDPTTEVRFYNNLELKINKIEWLRTHGSSKGYFNDFTIGPNEEIFLAGSSEIEIQECDINIEKKANANIFVIKLIPPYNDGSSEDEEWYQGTSDLGLKSNPRNFKNPTMVNSLNDLNERILEKHGPTSKGWRIEKSAYYYVYIDKKGEVIKVEPRSTNPEVFGGKLGEIIKQEIKNSSFKPGSLKGEPRNSVYMILLTFKF